MTIRYLWEDRVVNVASLTDNHNAISPHTKQVIRDIAYDYECNVKTRDVVDYLMPISLQQEEKRSAAFYMTKMYKFLEEVGALDISKLEEDEYFVEFMRERYEQNAYEEWEETNDAY